MNAIGNLIKMKTHHENPVVYQLELGGSTISLNELIGKNIRFEFQNEINCLSCGRRTKKSFAQGYCYPCFISIPETEECVLRPELCLAHEGIARDMEYAQKHCLNDHFVYLAVSSGLKVGVTRSSQIPTRWIDQGAIRAIKLARTPNRYTAGLIEVALKRNMADKTNWRNMLTNKIDDLVDLLVEKNKVINLLNSDLKIYRDSDDQVYVFHYPVNEYPQKVSSLNFDKTQVIEGVLQGIKGQYLIFENNEVINIRKFGGYKVLFKAN
ncbi:DUF2797 domain-containing protein [Bacteroidota bacterium]